MDKIIFLDIDGVLNVRRVGRDRFGSLFHSAFVKNLKTVINKTGAKIVISSSWRFNGFDEMRQMWIDRKLPGEVIGITPFTAVYLAGSDASFSERCERGCEIREWICTHGVTDYVILDDDNDMLKEQQDNFVRCSNNWNCKDHVEGYGLTKKCAEKAIHILNRHGLSKPTSEGALKIQNTGRAFVP